MVIGIYDSGLGGLSVWRELHSLNCPLVYFGDTAHVPYGEKTPAQLMDYFKASLAFFEGKGCTSIVVACNTTSAVVLPQVKGELKIPVVGMIENAVRAVSKVSEGRIGVLATQATVNSGVYQKALAEAIPQSKIFAQSAPEFVPIVEQGKVKGELAKRVAREYMEPLLAEEIDTLLLGCTHYSFLLDAITEVSGGRIKIIDPAPEVALQVRNTLARNCTSAGANSTEFWVSAHPNKFKDMAELVLGKTLPAVKLHS